MITAPFIRLLLPLFFAGPLLLASQVDRKWDPAPNGGPENPPTLMVNKRRPKQSVIDLQAEQVAISRAQAAPNAPREAAFSHPLLSQLAAVHAQQRYLVDNRRYMTPQQVLLKRQQLVRLLPALAPSLDRINNFPFRSRLWEIDVVIDEILAGKLRTEFAATGRMPQQILLDIQQKQRQLLEDYLQKPQTAPR